MGVVCMNGFCSQRIEGLGVARQQAAANLTASNTKQHDAPGICDTCHSLVSGWTQLALAIAACGAGCFPASASSCGYRDAALLFPGTGLYTTPLVPWACFKSVITRMSGPDAMLSCDAVSVP
jgi:hypothetical protein